MADRIDLSKVRVLPTINDGLLARVAEALYSAAKESTDWAREQPLPQWPETDEEVRDHYAYLAKQAYAAIAIDAGCIHRPIQEHR